ncbi:MAG: ABC-F family ATP-binding cassette domain-containing protein [Sporomusaceae bacterium]|nr:ABC-F family ATP-binding cassette domain-containing protein [Sporomusaceae bacterium]
MNILACEELCKGFSDKTLFDHITLHIDSGDKIGLIGVNGTGKSTLLKLIAGQLSPDAGKLWVNSQATVRYLPQQTDFVPEATVLEEVFSGDLPVMVCLRQYEAALQALEQDPGSQAAQQHLLNLTAKMDELEGWQLETEAKAALTALGITDFLAPMQQLSGGQRKRVALAGALVYPSDLLILDEPTNHVDAEAVEWLEEFLNKRKGALLMVTHDRYFLDRVANRMIELDGGRLYTYKGNYSDFLTLKAERLEREEAMAEKRENLYRRELAWIRRGAQARSTKQKARIERFEELKEQPRRVNRESLQMESLSSRLGKQVLELKEVTLSFDGQVILQDFSYIVLKNDRVGIVGSNGRGKSTLLNLIDGRLTPDSGVIERGQTVKIGYFSQDTLEMDDSLRVIEYIEEEAHYLERSDGTRITAAQLLERFLFPRSQQWTLLGKLSGGERRRLQLLRILMGAPNVLLLDEPTNDLDIETLTILEEYLDEFAGAVVAVSHDRYFLDKMADKIFAFEGPGEVVQYSGSYSDYEAKRQEKEKSVELLSTKEKPVAPVVKETSQPPRRQSVKLTFQEQKEYDGIEMAVAETEGLIKALTLAMEGAASDAFRLQELYDEKLAMEKKLDFLLERWAFLSEIVEEMERNRSQ